MLKHKRIRTKGKLGLSKVFREFNERDKVALIYQPGQKAHFPLRFHGKTGVIKGKRGNAFVVSVQDGGQNKEFIIKKIHLKKLFS